MMHNAFRFLCLPHIAIVFHIMSSKKRSKSIVFVYFGLVNMKIQFEALAKEQATILLKILKRYILSSD